MTRYRLSITLLTYLVSIGSFALGATASGDVMKIFHISPDGDDANAGTQSQPFATIGKARDAVRQINRNLTGDIVVLLHGGTYTITEPIVFDHRDSGTGGHKIVYRCVPGEEAIVSGGRRITGWQPDAGGRWKAKTDLDNFRQLYVDGERAIRARGDALPGAELHGTDGYKTTAAEMADWRNPDKAIRRLSRFIKKNPDCTNTANAANLLFQLLRRKGAANPVATVPISWCCSPGR